MGWGFGHNDDSREIDYTVPVKCEEPGWIEDYYCDNCDTHQIDDNARLYD